MKKFFYKSILGNLALAFCLAAVFYIPEWIFQRTGNMPLSAFAPGLAWLSLSMGLFLFSGLFGAALLTIDLVCFATPKIQRILKILFVSGILTVTALLLANNFTNTIWAVSISAKSGAPWVNYYRVGLVIVFAYALLEINGLARKPFLFRPGLLLTTSIVAALRFVPAISYSVYSRFAPSGLPQKFTTSLKPEELPNILFLQGDGINAANMSIYGYERETTPFLDSIKDRVNVWTNFYPSNCCTYGTTYALLTGISPMKHNIYYTPAQVPPEQTSWSLPDILKSLGYTTYQDTEPYSADAAFMGLTTAFDIGNESFERNSPVKVAIVNLVSPTGYKTITPAVHFARRGKSLATGLLNLSPTDEGSTYVASQYSSRTHPDDAKVARATRYISATKDPWFAQVHLMGTHGPVFEFRSTEFIDGKFPQVPWHGEFYDNSIREWDHDVQRIVQQLAKSRTKRETLVFLTSDHGMGWDSGVKVPLITFRVNDDALIQPLLPDMTYDKLDSLQESIDLAPTALAQIKAQPPPFWMTGFKLGESTANRIIVSAAELDVTMGELGGFVIDQKNAKRIGPKRVNVFNSKGRINFSEIPLASHAQIYGLESLITDYRPTNIATIEK